MYFVLLALSLAFAQNGPKPEVSFAALVQSLTPEEKDHLKKYADEALAPLIADPGFRGTLVKDLGDLIDHPDPEKLARFPTLKAEHLQSNQLAELLPDQREKPKPEPLKIENLAIYFADCSRPRIQP